MKFFINLIKKLSFKEPKRTLGRWNLDDCNIKINRKVDYSNEDHCGPCGDSNLKPNIENNISNIIILDKKKK